MVSLARFSKVEVNSPQEATKVFNSMPQQTPIAPSRCVVLLARPASCRLLPSSNLYCFNFFENPGNANIFWLHMSKGWFKWVLDSNLMSAQGNSPFFLSSLRLREELLIQPLPRGDSQTKLVIGGSRPPRCAQMAEEHLVWAFQLPLRNDPWRWGLMPRTPSMLWWACLMSQVRSGDQSSSELESPMKPLNWKEVMIKVAKLSGKEPKGLWLGGEWNKKWC